MSAVPITLVGSSTTTPDGQTTFVGVAITQGVGIGGGPIQPPLGIWGGGGVGNYPDAGFPGQQPGGGHPSHPISGGGQPSHPIAPGGPPPGPSQGPGFPTHPIAPGGQPPGIWGGGGVGNYPDAGFPVPQPPPGFPNPPPEGNKPPPPNGGWGYSSQYGWGFFPNPSGGGKPQPGGGEGGEEQPEQLPA